jgi:hypothetical protein
MPVKKKAKKKVVKKVVRKKSSVKKPKLICGVCGMEVIIDKTCGCAEVHPLVCCGRPMTQK